MQGCSVCVAISERLAILDGCPRADSNQAFATFWENLIPNALLIKGCAKTLSQVCSVFNQKYYQPFQLACAFSKKIFPSWTQLKAQNCCAPNWSVFSPFGGPLMPPSCNISTFKYFNQPVLNESYFQDWSFRIYFSVVWCLCILACSTRFWWSAILLQLSSIKTRKALVLFPKVLPAAD